MKAVPVALALFLVSGCSASEPPPCPFQGEADFAASVELTEPFPERWTDHLLEVVGDYVF